MAPRAVRPADIIFGCGPITKKYGGPEQVVVDGAVDAALQAGVVDFDTAPLYGDSSPAAS
jgi:aryl-alcohol dehydrogenase-like predicted oxidoreductase